MNLNICRTSTWLSHRNCSSQRHRHISANFLQNFKFWWRHRSGCWHFHRTDLPAPETFKLEGQSFDGHHQCQWSGMYVYFKLKQNWTEGVWWLRRQGRGLMTERSWVWILVKTRKSDFFLVFCWLLWNQLDLPLNICCICLQMHVITNNYGNREEENLLSLWCVQVPVTLQETGVWGK